jgi:hypothetical protein
MLIFIDVHCDVINRQSSQLAVLLLLLETQVHFTKEHAQQAHTNQAVMPAPERTVMVLHMYSLRKAVYCVHSCISRARVLSCYH